MSEHRRPLRYLGAMLTVLASDQRLSGPATAVTAFAITGEKFCRRRCGLDVLADRRHGRELATAPRLASDPDSRSRRHINWHEGGAGAPVVLIGGFGANGLMWPQAWVRELEREHRVIRVDNRGTGWSRHCRGPFTIADLADDVRDVLGACGVESATVIGHSMGGLVAQELAIRHPGLVDRLLLVSTIPPPPAFVPAQDYAAVLRLMLSGGIGAFASTSPVVRGEQLLAFASDAFEGTAEAAAELGGQLLARPTTPYALLRQVRALGAWSDPERLAAISAPTTVIHGADDPIVAPANGRVLADLIPEAEFIELPAVGHMVPWEAPDQPHLLLKD